MFANSAAVLIGILDNKIILTKRSAELRSFTGQVCLPGGKFDQTDSSIVSTAIREFSEEVYFTGNIEPLFCLLPETSVVFKQVVYPVVARLDGVINGFNIAEVAKLFSISLDELNLTRFSINPDHPNIKHNQCFWHDGELVWGLTAHILYNFIANIKFYF